MASPSLSIIVPIYNVEPYLERCINSILHQDYQDFELILVDDGSRDGCPSICDGFASSLNKDGGGYNNIIVLHKENGGQAAARNAGLAHARGAYIGFVDGDDWIEPDMYARLMKIVSDSGADIGIAGYVEDDGTKTERKSGKAVSGVYKADRLCELKREMLYAGTYYEQAVIPSVCNKVFKREILAGNVSSIHPDIRMGEDSACTYPCLLDADCVVIDNDICAYHYMRRAGSMSRSFDERYFYRTALLFKLLDEKFSHSDIDGVCEQLRYYKLFMIQYGISGILRCNDKSLFKKNAEIKEVVKNFDTEKLIASLNFEGFAADERRKVMMLSNSKERRKLMRNELKTELKYKIKKLLGRI